MATRNLIPSSLDFEDIKAAYKAFLRSQDRFKDFDFDGANITVELELESYNTWLNGFWLNMVHSERMLDSCQLRDSAVSISKDLNYTPRSMRSAVASLSLTFPSSGITLLEIPKGTQFSGVNANGSFTYVTDRTRTFRSPNNYFAISNLEIFEGSYFTESFVMDSSNETQRFVLSNEKIDSDSLQVQITADGANTIYSRATNLYGLDGTSNVFFLQATSANTYELEFGSNVLGHRPEDGSVIQAIYRVCRGEAANEVDTFVLDSDIAAFNGGTILSPFTIKTEAPSAGGSSAEDIDSIRFSAPRHYETQEHAITVSDYETLVRENFPDVKSVSVFGGEDVTDSVEYGRTFISLVTQSGGSLSTPRKDDVRSFVLARNTFAIDAIVIDSEQLLLEVDVTAHVDFTNTILSRVQIQSLIDRGVSFWNGKYLQRFKSVYQDSRFTTYLNNLDPTIQSTETEIKIKKNVSFPLNVPFSIKTRLNNAIKPGVQSSEFISTGKRWMITDSVQGVTNPGGLLYLLEINISNVTPNYRTIGNVTYDTGLIQVGSLTVTDFLRSPGVTFRATPVSKDVKAVRNDVVEIDVDTGVTIDVVSE